MKKKLLLLSAAFLAIGAMSATETDITPSAYDFNNVTSFAYGNYTVNKAHVQSPAFVTAGGTEAWNNGLVVITGGQMSSTSSSNYTNLVAGTSLVDLGGEVGQVLCISGASSNVADALNAKYPGNDVTITPCPGNVNGYVNIHFFTDPNNTPTTDTLDTNAIRVRVTMNVYSNYSGINVLSNIIPYTDCNEWLPTTIANSSNMAVSSSEFLDENGAWDPTKWMVYEFDTWCPDSAAAGYTNSIRARLAFNATTIDESTIFIKKIEFVKIDRNIDPISATSRQKSYEELTPAFAEEFVPSEVLGSVSVGDEVTANGIVTALCARGFIVSDNSGSILYYYGSGFDTDAYKVGDQITISGTISSYGTGYQFSNSATITVRGSQEYTYPEPEVYTGAQLDEIVARTGNSNAIYAQFTGTLAISGNYYNFTVDGASTAQGSLYQATDAQKALFTDGAGEQYVVTGYLVSVSSSRYVNFIVTNVAPAESVTAENVTPSAYYYNDVTSFSYLPNAGTGANFNANYTTPIFENIGGTQYWDNGLVGVTGGQFGNTAQSYFTDLKAGTSLVNLGGTVGQVLCVSGQNSKINDELKELYGVDMNIQSCTGGLNWFNFNWFMDPSIVHTGTPDSDAIYPKNTVRARLTINIYSNNVAQDYDYVVNKAYFMTDQNNPTPTSSVSNSFASSAIMGGDFRKYAEDGETYATDADGNYMWDPTRWLVYEVDAYCPDAETDTLGNAVNHSPLRFKMEMLASGLASATMFIKSVEFINYTNCPDLIDPTTRNREYVTYTLSPQVSGVGAVETEEAAKYTVNGQAVTFTEDAVVYGLTGAVVAEVEAGEAQTLEKGFYVAKVGDKGVKFVIR